MRKVFSGFLGDFFTKYCGRKEMYIYRLVKRRGNQEDTAFLAWNAANLRLTYSGVFIYNVKLQGLYPKGGFFSC